MTITNGYTDLQTMKGADVLNIDVTDNITDALIELAVEAASRTIDLDCGRYFYKSATDEVRYHSPEWSDKIYPGDIVSITELATDEAGQRTYTDVWSASADYDLLPYNAPATSRPYTSISVTLNGAYRFSTYPKSVRMTGIFGWPVVPPQIEQACILLATRLVKRLTTPLGVASMAELGEVRIGIKDKDPDYWHLIAGFIKL